MPKADKPPTPRVGGAKRKSGRRSHNEGSVEKRKDGTWRSALTTGYTAEGKQKRRYVYGKTEKEVLEKLKKIRAAFDEGNLTEPNRMLMKDYLQQWLETKEQALKPNTFYMYSRYVNTHILPRIGRSHLVKLNALQIQDMQNKIIKEVGATTAESCRTVLFQALKHAVKLGLIPRNPAEMVDRVKKTHREMKFWEPAHITNFLETAKTSRLYALFYLALTTGMRRGELLGLRWSDLQKGALRISQTVVVIGNKLELGTPKTKGSQRRIPLPTDTIKALEEHRERQSLEVDLQGDLWVDQSLVFPNTLGSPLHPRNLEREWYRLLEVSGVPPIRMHDMRHTYASLAVRKGVDPKTLADRLGHSRASLTLDVYAHVFEDARDASAITLADLLDGSKDPK